MVRHRRGILVVRHISHGNIHSSRRNILSLRRPLKPQGLNRLRYGQFRSRSRRDPTTGYPIMHHFRSRNRHTEASYAQSDSMSLIDRTMSRFAWPNNVHRDARSVRVPTVRGGVLVKSDRERSDGFLIDHSQESVVPLPVRHRLCTFCPSLYSVDVH